MLRLADRWIWDHWLVTTPEAYHAFFLQAPRALGDPELRHAHATVGHAVSADLVDWQLQPDALVPGPPGAWDDRAIWTGSIIRGPDAWLLAYTGTSHAEHGLIQRIGVATSSDLVTWQRVGDGLALEADPRWYHVGRPEAGEDTPWRDPWLLRDPDGHGWHLLATARGRDTAGDSGGVVGHAWSPDLLGWEARPPLTAPGEFGHLEVTQVTEADGRWLLSFCTGPNMISAARRARVGREPTGTYLCPADGPLGPFQVERARCVSDLYAGRLVRRRDGRLALMGFVERDPNGGFGGYLPDPVPLEPAELSWLPVVGR